MTYIDRTNPSAPPAIPPASLRGDGAYGTGGTPLPKDRITLSGRVPVAREDAARKDDPKEEPKDSSPKAQVDALIEGRGLRPSDIALCLSMGRVDAAIEVAARLTGVPTQAAVYAYQQGDAGRAISQLASIGVDGATAGWLLRGMGRVLPGQYGESNRAASAYERTASLSKPSGAEPTDPEELTEGVDFRI